MYGYELGGLGGGSNFGSELTASANLGGMSGQGWKMLALEGERKDHFAF